VERYVVTLRDLDNAESANTFYHRPYKELQQTFDRAEFGSGINVPSNASPTRTLSGRAPNQGSNIETGVVPIVRSGDGSNTDTGVVPMVGLGGDEPDSPVVAAVVDVDGSDSAMLTVTEVSVETTEATVEVGGVDDGPTTTVNPSVGSGPVLVGTVLVGSTDSGVTGS